MRSIQATARHNSTQGAAVTATPVRRQEKNGAMSWATDGVPAFAHDSTLFSTLFVQPEQFLAEPRGVLQRTGAYRLLLAVLQDALECWFRYRHARSTRERRLFREIVEWFSAHDRNRLFAFECICDYLELDPNYIRHGLKQWQAARSGQPAPRFHLTPVMRNQTRLAYEVEEAPLMAQGSSLTILPQMTASFRKRARVAEG